MMVLALSLCGAALLLALAGLFAFGVRRRLLQRSGGTFDCNLRWNAPALPAPPAYSDETAHDEQGAGQSQGPGQGQGSGHAQVHAQGHAQGGGKGWAYGIARYNGDQIEWFRVFSYAPRPRRFLHGTRVELAMSEDALTGFLAWLEAAPPGQRVNVA